MRLEKDSKATVQDHPIQTGDEVLLRRKTTKHTSGYDPEAYTVTGVYGTQVEAEREGTRKVRDLQKWKKVTIIQPRSYAQGANQPTRSTYQTEPDIGTGVTQGQAEVGQARGQREVEGGTGQHEVGEE